MKNFVQKIFLWSGIAGFGLFGQIGDLQAAAAAKKPKAFKGKSHNLAEEEEALYYKYLNPANEVPKAPEKSRWRIANTSGGKTVATNSVPLYSFTEGSWGRLAGEIPIGTEIKLDTMLGFGERMYYGVKRPVTLGNGKVVDKILYVEGTFVEKAD